MILNTTIRTTIGALAFLIVAAPAALAQDSAAEVEAVIANLFDGMRAGDTAAVRRTFHEEMALMSTETNPEGAPVVGSASADRFVSMVGQQPAGSLDERLGAIDTWTEDNLAVSRMKYAFHFKGALSHCGVNVFVIARTADGWKIVSVADTRRIDGCDGWLN